MKLVEQLRQLQSWDTPHDFCKASSPIPASLVVVIFSAFIIPRLSVTLGWLPVAEIYQRLG
jgi:hypothetical protein